MKATLINFASPLLGIGVGIFVVWISGVLHLNLADVTAAISSYFGQAGSQPADGTTLTYGFGAVLGAIKSDWINKILSKTLKRP